MPQDPNALLGFFIGPLLVAELIVLVRRFPILGMWVFMAAAVLSSFSWPRSGLTFLGYQVYALDIASAALLGASAFRLIERRPCSRWLSLLMALLAIALVRGLTEFGSQAAVNAARGLLYVLVATLFIEVSLGVQAWPKLQQLWLVTAGALVVAALVYFARFGLGTYSASGDRALNSAQTLVVAQAGLISLAIPGHRQRLFAALCFLVVLASQQRTVWAATLTTGLVLAVGHRTADGARVSRVVRRGMMAALVAVVFLLVLGPSQLQESVSTATSTVSTDSGTFGWRLEGWTELLQQYAHKPGLDQVVGQPLGAGFARSVGGAVTAISPHNMYITVLLSLGAVGLVGFILLLIVAFRRATHAGAVPRALLTGLAVFSVGYQVSPEQGLILGATLALASPALRSQKDLQLV